MQMAGLKATWLTEGTANTVPLKSGVKGMRLLMGSKFVNQALPLVSREAPFVQTTDEGGIDSTERRMGSQLGAVRADQNGVVTAKKSRRVYAVISTPDLTITTKCVFEVLNQIPPPTDTA